MAARPTQRAIHGHADAPDGSHTDPIKAFHRSLRRRKRNAGRSELVRHLRFTVDTHDAAIGAHQDICPRAADPEDVLVVSHVAHIRNHE